MRTGQLIIFCLGISLSLCETQQSVTQSLGGTWVAKETEYWYEFPATVPGGVYTDLMNLNILEDIFYGYNDNSTRWVGNINWTYALNFTVDEGLLDYENVNLVFEGVDTFATIIVNNVTIGETQNMFVRYVFDIKDILKAEGNNTIKIYFANPVERGLNLNNEQLKKYRIPWECPPDAYHGECHINMLRKMQASFSWDWGPSFPSMGIWKPVYLEGYNSTRIRELVAYMIEDDENYNLHLDTYFADNNGHAVNGILFAQIILDHGGAVIESYDTYETPDENGEIVKKISLEIEKEDVELWWPNGYGDQKLYDVSTIFTSASNPDDTITKTIKFGFRTIELVQEPLDTGATFYFKVNGAPIFAKGSNEIPINVLPELGQDKETIKYLLQSAKDVNMNMLRVWGGGVYESDYFYELADQMGIMIWQDFMFACSLYPASDTFLDNVKREINYNIKRLMYHPSIVVWSGNNENEGVLVDNWYGTADLFDTYKADYVKLYITTIKAELDRISASSEIFISSSPSNGNLTVSEGWVGSSPGNTYWGDIHYYNYILDPWDSNTYKIPRFCSEYGYQSYPLEDTWATATNDSKDLEMSSDFMDWRQHHSGGNAEMALLIGTNLQIPDEKSANFSKAFFYLSQVYTSQAIKVETEHYRRYRSYLTDDGQGYTMGALYWQLNDVWVAPTWSSIDYTRRWKMLHYFALDFFASIIVTGHINGARELQLYTVNDKLESVDDASVLLRLYNYSSLTPVYEKRYNTTLAASSSQLIDTIQTDEFLTAHSCTKNTCFFYFLIQKNPSASDSVLISPQNYVFPGKLKESSVAAANVVVEDITISGNLTFDVTIKSDNVALFVWLDAHEIRGRFSENGFILVEASRTINFVSEVEVDVATLQKVLTVTHLKDPKWD